MKIKENAAKWSKISFFEILVLGLMLVLFMVVWGSVRIERIFEKKDLPVLESLEEVAVYPQKVMEKSDNVERIAKAGGPTLATKVKEENLLARAITSKAVEKEKPRVLTSALPIVPPAVLYQAPPEYPLAAIENGFEGLTVLLLQILKNGQVGEVKLETSSGRGILDEAAILGVKNWHFAPARQGSEPVEVWFKIPIRFQLRS